MATQKTVIKERYCSRDMLMEGLRCGFSSVHIPSNKKELEQQLEVTGKKERFRYDKRTLGKNYALSSLMHPDCNTSCQYFCSTREEYLMKKEELKRKKCGLGGI